MGKSAEEKMKISRFPCACKANIEEEVGRKAVEISCAGLQENNIAGVTGSRRPRFVTIPVLVCNHSVLACNEQLKTGSSICVYL